MFELSALTQIAKGVAKAARTIEPQERQVTKAEKLPSTVNAAHVEDFFSRNMPVVGKTEIQNYELVKAAILELQKPDPDNLDALYNFNGFGAIRNIFDSSKDSHAKRLKWLSNNLSTNELSAAKEASLTSFYTPVCISTAIWDAFELSGFSTGRILDPAVGSGRLIAPINSQVKADSDLTLIEYDTTSFKVAEALYPNANTINAEFQDVKIPLQDLIVANPPYNSVRTSDRTGLSISAAKLHTFFVLKSLMSLRNKGVGTFIMPTSFMDDSNDKDRKEISKYANLIGAVRVPFELFENNSNTKMSVDVLSFEREQNPELAPTWLDTIESSVGSQYFNMNAALGTDNFINLSKPVEDFLFNKKQVLWSAENKADIEAQVYKAILKSLSNFRYTSFKHKDAVANSDVELANPSSAEPFTFNTTSDNGLVFQSSDGFYDVDATENGIKYKRIQGMIEIARIAEDLFAEECKVSADEKLMELLRTSLNETYNAFVKKCGFISSRANSLAFKRDRRYASLLALEVNYDAGTTKSQSKLTGLEYKAPSAKKAQIFSERAYTPWILPTSAETIKDALDLSLAFTGEVDFELIASLVGETKSRVESSLMGEFIFYDPRERKYVLSDVYLSGDVKSKLELAKQLESTDTRLASNIVALNSVLPKDITLGDITLSMTSAWLPAEILEEFVIEKLGFLNGSKMVHTLGSWKANLVGNGDQVAQVEYKTDTHNLRQLLSLIFRFGEQVVKIYGDDNKVIGVDHLATGTLKQAIRNLELDFLAFVEPKAEIIERCYNEKVNRFAPFMSAYTNAIYPDLNPSFTPYNHQNGAIQRGISSTGNGLLLDAAIGSGKTAVYAILCHELVRLGLKKRICIEVPNHLVGQTAAEWLRLYPSDRSKLLVLNSKSLSPKERLETLERIKTSEINFVIVPFSTATRITPPMRYVDLEVEKRLEELDEVRTYDESRLTVREVENIKKRLKEQVKKVKANYDGSVCFESLQFDGLFIDEAHAVKNSGYSTSMLKNVKGVGTLEPSNFALDASFKISYLINTYSNSGVVLGTGTSLANSLIEIYGYLRLLAPELAKAASIHCLDDFASYYVSVDESYEIKPEGTVALTRRCKSFNNLEELSALFSSFSFTITSEELLELLPPIVDSQGNDHCAVVPMTGGKPIACEVDISDQELEYMNTLVERAQDYKNSPVINDNALLLISDARKASLSPQAADAHSETVLGSKTLKMIDDVVKSYQRNKGDKTCQICFVDYGTPSKEKDQQEDAANKLRAQADAGCQDSYNELTLMRGVSVNLYRHIKLALVDAGIPENEIAFTQDYDTDSAKQYLYEQINKGNKAVVISTFKKLSTGANIQKRISAIRVLTAPLTPAELWQGIGRGIRQGHELYIKAIKALSTFSVDVVLYALNKSLDAWGYQLLEAKSATISAFRKGTLSGIRQLNLESDVITYGEIKASVSGMQELIELKKNERAIFDEESAYRSFLNKQSFTRNAIDMVKGKIYEDKQLSADALSDFECLIANRDASTLSFSMDGAEFSSVSEVLATAIYDKYSRTRGANLGATSDRFTELFTMSEFSIQTVQIFSSSACFVLGPSGRKYYLNKNCHNRKLLPEAIRVIKSFKYVSQEALKRVQKNEDDLSTMTETLGRSYDLSSLRALEARNKELVAALDEATTVKSANEAQMDSESRAA
ncbi:N-6 DNA methylase [Vibrio sp. Makdt]|uniref:N-6 DNA methylase n=1 Tax=Vibrio sp. Makdt TaxID=2998828 RepID=UPI0022CD4504|nr:N-6 DNA methylase [Vibrio sp. Makdt]MDA0152435.1 N-6 DNA methylase [Vibrio sp. Makdt]